MELRQFRYFVAVAEELHFTRAAARLHIAQPPLSLQIRQLERELGVSLLARTKRHVELTPAGKAFLIEARRVLSASAAAVGAAQRAGRGETGRLVVGYVESVGYRLLPEIVRQHRAKWPAVELVLQQLITAAQLEAFETNQIDVGLIRTTAASDPGLAIEVLIREPLLAALPEGHDLARRGRLKLSDLAKVPWVFVPPYTGAGLYEQIVGVCHGAGFTPHVVQHAPQMPSVISLVASGIGVSLVPEWVTKLGHAGVRYVPLARPVPTSDIAVAWRRETSIATVLPFVATVREVAANAQTANRTSRSAHSGGRGSKR